MLQASLPHLNSLRWILASGSPRRSDCLRGLGLKFEVINSGFPEDLDWREFLAAAGPDQALAGAKNYCVENACRKAQAVWDRCEREDERRGVPDVIIGADTVVVWDGNVVEKPESVEAATSMIRNLSGSQHHVQSGVCLLLRRRADSKAVVRTFGVSTAVTFADLSDEQVAAYVATDSPYDKAGGYGIQEPAGGSMVASITGDYYNVTGFPLHAFCKEVLSLMDDPELALGKQEDR